VIFIRPTRAADIEDIIPRLRAHDRKTIERLGLDPVRLLRDTYMNGSPMFTADLDGVPACMWGLEKKTVLSPWMLWMLTTDAIDDYPIRFLRESRKIIQSLSSAYGTIEGLVDSDFDVSVKWLRWLGFHEVAEGEFKKMRYSCGD
jgi:hypothetical protein